MNTHAVPALPQAHSVGTHQSGRLYLEVARRNAARPVSSAVVASSASPFGVLLAATIRAGGGFSSPALSPQPQRRGSGMKALQLLPVGCPQPQLGGASFVASRPFGG